MNVIDRFDVKSFLNNSYNTFFTELSAWIGEEVYSKVYKRTRGISRATAYIDQSKSEYLGCFTFIIMIEDCRYELIIFDMFVENIRVSISEVLRTKSQDVVDEYKNEWEKSFENVVMRKSIMADRLMEKPEYV